MKRTLITLTALLIFLSAKAQKSDTLKNNMQDTSVHFAPEHDPEFPGGINEFLKYVAMTIRYPQGAYENGIQGKVYVQMIIEKDGSVSNVTVIRRLNPLLDKEAVRVVSTSPKWIPATLNGHPVRGVYTLPVAFKVTVVTRN